MVGQLEEETSASDEDKEDYTDEDKEEYGDCGADFDSTQPCEGSWEAVCLQDSLIWWCQDRGVDERRKNRRRKKQQKN